VSLSLGIVGLPNAGKSTLFNALTSGHAAVASYPFTTIDPNVGVVHVPDDRLRQIADLLKPPRVVPAAIEFVDIAGLVQSASKGEGLGNQFLGHIRNVDAVVLVARCFADEDVPQVHGEVDPVADVGLLLTELQLADLQTVQNRLERLQTPARSGIRSVQHEFAALKAVEAALDAGQGALSIAAGSDPAADGLLTAKPCLVVANVDEAELADVARAGGPDDGPAWLRGLRSIADRLGAKVVPVAAKLELELNDLDPAEAEEYLRSLGATQRGLPALIQESYRLLRLVTFYTTTGGQEVRAWSIPEETPAPRAAGRIHTDMERGFIRAEVVPAANLIAFGSVTAAREHGHVRIEGREYVVRDGDVIHFRFNV
jgi:ribosome-binding ATPase